MIRNSALYRSFCTAWELACDSLLPTAFQAVNPENSDSDLEDFNPLYFLPVWGALAGLAALIFGKLAAAVLPVNGSAVIFALTLMIFSELRTSGRGLALNVTMFAALFEHKNFLEARQQRISSLKNTNGVIPLLLAIGILGGKFFAVMLTARTGHFGVAAAAWIIALSAEGLFASEECAMGVPRFCRNAKGEYVVALGGFLLLFNLVFLPLATLIVCASAVAITVITLVLLIKRAERIDSDDMTTTGYILEFAVWAVYAVLIG